MHNHVHLHVYGCVCVCECIYARLAQLNVHIYKSKQAPNTPTGHADRTMFVGFKMKKTVQNETEMLLHETQILIV